MQQVRLTLPMIPNMELTASKTACAMGEQIGLSADKIDEVQMAVVEACINAFEHSSSQDREVRVLLQVLEADDAPTGLQIVIQDHGVGFTVEQRHRGSRDRPEGPQKRGFGLMIIDGLMDDVDIRSSAEGTTVVMRKML